MSQQLQAAFAQFAIVPLPGISKEEQPNNIALASSLDTVILLDQTLLPATVKYLELQSKEAFYDAIKRLAVRGAPAIGIFAAYAYYVLARKNAAEDKDAFLRQMAETKDYLNSSRPTAVNLSWALNRMHNCCLKAWETQDKQQVLETLLNEALKIQVEDILMCKAISEHALSLLKANDGLLTHCNAGPLATSFYGTALGPMLLGQSRNYNFHVFADETRPLLQGARLTSFELHNAGIDVTLLCDNMASLVMSQGKVQACLVGTDRIAANGDIANKIGTSGVAILAKHYNIPFYVLGPSSTIDFNCASGKEIVIEERQPAEVAELWYKERMAPEGIKIFNPAFDVTDHSLITAIITEDGIFRAPYTESLAQIKAKHQQ